jgi:hypothetical protein
VLKLVAVLKAMQEMVNKTFGYSLLYLVGSYELPLAHWQKHSCNSLILSYIEIICYDYLKIIMLIKLWFDYCDD